MARRPPAPGHNVKLSLGIYADAIKAADAMGLPNVGKYVERAVSNQLAADREAYKVNRFRADRHAAERDISRSMPYGPDYGLPPDFDMPDAMPAPSAISHFRR